MDNQGQGGSDPVDPGLDFAQGLGEGLWDSAAGLVTAAVDVLSDPIGVRRITNVYNMVAENGVGGTATAVIDSITQPYTSRWNSGHQAAAVGYGAAEVILAIVGTKGLTKVTKVATAVEGAEAAGARGCVGGRCTIPGQCFVAGTLVLLAGGSSVPIEQMKLGDRVVTTDPITGQESPHAVTTLYKHENQPVYEVFIDGATITATPRHPFWVKGQGWIPVDRLRPGDELLQPDDTTITVQGVRDTDRTATVYNFEVEGAHDYYVKAGSHWILVHNDCGYTPAGGFAGSDIDEVAQSIYQHIGEGDTPGRPGFGKIREALTRGTPQPHRQGDGSVAQIINYGGVRVIINEDRPWRSTAYFPGGG